MMTSLQLCLLAARAEGLICVDGVYNAFKDDDGLKAECSEGRDMGFDGKTLIHPAQIAIKTCMLPLHSASSPKPRPSRNWRAKTWHY